MAASAPAPVPASASQGQATRLASSDGAELSLRDWPVDEGPARATVLLVHGLGEHVGRYDPVARRLNDWGFAVRGYDHYGHGESAGPRGGLTSDLRLLDDLADLVDATRARMPQGQPLVLLGHSMGGLVAARFVAMHLRPIDALVLSSTGTNIVTLGSNADSNADISTLIGGNDDSGRPLGRSATTNERLRSRPTRGEKGGESVTTMDYNGKVRGPP